jgi:uncharacterized protein
VHTFGMRFSIDVAYVDKSNKVIRTQMMMPGKLGPWVPRSVGVIEAEAGRFQRWSLGTDSVIEFAA